MKRLTLAGFNFLDGQSLLVRRDSGISDISGLEGKTVAAIAGSTSIEQIETYAQDNQVSLEVLPFQEYPPALAALKRGTVDGLTTDSIALNQFAQDDDDFIVVGGLFTEEPYGMGLPAGDSYFAALVNFTLQDLKENGTYDQLYQKWFGDSLTPYDVKIWPGEWPYTFADSPTTALRQAQGAPDPSVLEKLLTEGRFVAGVKYDFAPFGFLDGSKKDQEDQLKGFDIDIMREFAKRWLDDENAVEFVQVTSADRMPKLAAGEVDILAASMTHTKARNETIDFSQTYFLDGQSLLVRKKSDIQGVADLDGKTIAAIRGSTSIDNIQSKADELGITIEILPFQEYPQALEALKAKQVDALTTDSSLLSSFAQQNEALQVVGEQFTSEPYGLGVPNYDDQFRDLVNFTLQEMKADGTYDALYRKWFGDAPYPIEIWPGEPADAQIQEMIAGEGDSSGKESDSSGDESDSSGEESDSTKLPTQYTVVEGDILSRLAARFYNNPHLYRLIYNANADVIGDDPNHLRVGAILTIPEAPE